MRHKREYEVEVAQFRAESYFVLNTTKHIVIVQ